MANGLPRLMTRGNQISHVHIEIGLRPDHMPDRDLLLLPQLESHKGKASDHTNISEKCDRLAEVDLLHSCSPID